MLGFSTTRCILVSSAKRRILDPMSETIMIIIIIIIIIIIKTFINESAYQIYIYLP